MHFLILKLSTAVFETHAETSNVNDQESLYFKHKETHS